MQKCRGQTTRFHSTVLSTRTLSQHDEERELACHAGEFPTLPTPHKHTITLAVIQCVQGGDGEGVCEAEQAHNMHNNTGHTPANCSAEPPPVTRCDC